MRAILIMVNNQHDDHRVFIVVLLDAFDNVDQTMMMMQMMTMKKKMKKNKNLNVMMIDRRIKAHDVVDPIIVVIHCRRPVIDCDKTP
jgi:hypothetical protein